MGHLAKRMNPRIGAARALHHGRLAIDLRNGRREHALNGFVIELNLPAVKFSAVVFEGELVARHQVSLVPLGNGKSAQECGGIHHALSFPLQGEKANGFIAAGNAQLIIKCDAGLARLIDNFAFRTLTRASRNIAPGAGKWRQSMNMIAHLVSRF